MDPVFPITTRASRLADATEAAIERVAAHAGDSSDDLFAHLGEALFWLTALMDETHPGGAKLRQLDPLLLALRFARNQVAHGLVLTAPTKHHGAFTLGRSRLGGGDVLGGPAHSWAAVESIQLKPGRRDRDVIPHYRLRLTGRSVVRTLREGLDLAREPGS